MWVRITGRRYVLHRTCDPPFTYQGAGDDLSPFLIPSTRQCHEEAFT